MEQNEGKLSKWKGFFSSIGESKKQTKILVTVGLIGMALILLSEMIPSGTAKKSTTPVLASTNEQYVQQMETKLTDMIGSIDGVGTVKVMVTLEHGAEKRFASETKSTEDKTQDYQGSDTKKVQQRVNSENKYILVDGEDGREALVSTEISPKVKGVVIVCQGADDAQVQQRVTNAVTTILGVGANQVCVTKSTENKQ